MAFFNSRYNFLFKVEGGHLLYNSKTGATVNLTGIDSELLGKTLVGARILLDEDVFDKELFDTLLSRGFLVEENRDELLEIKEQYWKARGETPVVLTLTATMDCNLGCYYCYEERSRKRLEFEDTNAIIDHLRLVYKDNKKRSLHVDWYGGEPLLNIEYINQASVEIQKFCRDESINYHASIISNGTLWPENVEEFVQKHKIRQVQISFDGMKQNHNKRRRYRKEFGTEENNSFDIILALVEKLLNIVTVDVRFNLDWNNKNDIDPFLDLIISRGWFNRRYPVIFQPARLSSYTEKASFMRKKQLSIEEFDSIRSEVREKLEEIGKVEESEVPDGFPFPKTHVCAALATDSFVIGSDKLIYRCGLQVGESHRAVGSLNNSERKFPDSIWWGQFDPTEISSCSSCSFLPICFGGCPKKHLEQDSTALQEQSEYWRNNLAQKVSGFLGKTLIEEDPISEDLQFRPNY